MAVLYELLAGSGGAREAAESRERIAVPVGAPQGRDA